MIHVDRANEPRAWVTRQNRWCAAVSTMQHGAGEPRPTFPLNEIEVGMADSGMASTHTRSPFGLLIVDRLRHRTPSLCSTTGCCYQSCGTFGCDNGPRFHWPVCKEPVPCKQCKPAVLHAPVLSFRELASTSHLTLRVASVPLLPQDRACVVLKNRVGVPIICNDSGCMSYS